LSPFLTQTKGIATPAKKKKEKIPPHPWPPPLAKQKNRTPEPFIGYMHLLCHHFSPWRIPPFIKAGVAIFTNSTHTQHLALQQSFSHIQDH